MGIAVVLFFYAAVLSVAATFCALGLTTISAWLIKLGAPRRKRTLVIVALFPFLCVGYAGACFSTYAIINYKFFHRDPGLGDSWETPLPNGYALMMVDTTDQGTIYNPRTQGGYGVVTSSADSEFGVRQMQVANHLIFGARDTDYFNHIGQESTVVDTYFDLNTRTNTKVEYKSLAELKGAAKVAGVPLDLHSFESVFGQYRSTWFDLVAIITLLALPAFSFILLVRWVWLQRSRRIPPSSA